MGTWVTVLAFAAALLAALWPALSKAVSTARLPAKGGIDRADWVNRLFSLAQAADETGESSIASSARSLIAALVSTEPAKRGK